eukprot:gene4057-5079_t
MAGKKFGTNSKSEEARAKKDEIKKDAAIKKAKAAEDALWEEKDEKVLAKQKKNQEKEEKKAADAKKKAENRDLLKKEEEELKSKYGKPKDKLTRFEIQKIQEKEQREREKQRQAAAGPSSSTTTTTTTTSALKKSKEEGNEEEDEEDTFDLEENINHILREKRLAAGESLVEARDVEQAINALSGNQKEDLHPERRMKAAFLTYEAENLPILRKENPSLKFTQVKQMLWRQWLKAPENPMNKI